MALVNTANGACSIHSTAWIALQRNPELFGPLVGVPGLDKGVKHDTDTGGGTLA